MLYREIMAVCSEIHTKHINAVCGQNVEFVNVKLVVHIVTTGLYYVSCHRPILPGNSLDPTVIPTAQASSFTLQYFPYYV